MKKRGKQKHQKKDRKNQFKRNQEKKSNLDNFIAQFLFNNSTPSRIHDENIKSINTDHHF